MLIRAVLMGTILASLTGAAVYFGFGEDISKDSLIPVDEASRTDKVSGDISVLTDKTPMNPKSTISVKPVPKSPVARENSNGLNTDTTTTDTSKSSEKTLKALLSKGEKDKVSKDIVESQNDETSAETIVKRPKAVGSVTVSETPLETTKDREFTQDNTDQIIPKNMLKMDLKKARRVTDKTTRDKIYLEIFDKAIQDNNLDMARRIAGKLSTPELRELAGDRIANSVQ
ncbi:MAG: hypothetical protein ABJG88_10745 [Litorimonas sp.]